MLSPRTIPMGRVCARLDPKQFEACFLNWVRGLHEKIAGVIAIDGKTLRGSHDRAKGKQALHLVSSWAGEKRLVLAQVAGDEKSNEITAIAELLHLLALEGCIVTIDEMGAQRALAAQISEQQADYALALKENQGSLYENVTQTFARAHTEAFRDTAHQSHETIEQGHGRGEIRTHWIIDDDACLDYLEQEGKWRGIENSVHWVLDIAFREDESRIRTGHADHTLAVLRHLALNLLRQEKTAKVGDQSQTSQGGLE